MKIKSALLLALAAILTLPFVTPAARAKNGNPAIEVKINLVHAPEFPTAKGTAKLKLSAKEQEFEVEAQVSKKLAGAILAVTVNDAVVGTMAVTTLGTAQLSLKSKTGQTVPAIQTGTLVGIVTDTGAIILAGKF